MIYNMNDMSSLAEDFFISYFSVFPFTYKVYLNHNQVHGILGVLSEKDKLYAYYEYKKKMDELPHYHINKKDFDENLKDMRQTFMIVEK